MYLKRAQGTENHYVYLDGLKFSVIIFSGSLANCLVVLQSSFTAEFKATKGTFEGTYSMSSFDVVANRRLRDKF